MLAFSTLVIRATVYSFVCWLSGRDQHKVSENGEQIFALWWQTFVFFFNKIIILKKKKSTLNVIIEWHWDNIDDKYYTIVYIDGNVIMTVINV